MPEHCVRCATLAVPIRVTTGSGQVRVLLRCPVCQREWESTRPEALTPDTPTRLGHSNEPNAYIAVRPTSEGPLSHVPSAPRLRAIGMLIALHHVMGMTPTQLVISAVILFVIAAPGWFRWALERSSVLRALRAAQLWLATPDALTPGPVPCAPDSIVLGKRLDNGVDPAATTQVLSRTLRTEGV